MVIEKKAFTLIELLVTIAVIAILAGLLLPTLNAARERVKTISCLNNEKSLGGALIQYSMDNALCLSGRSPQALERHVELRLDPRSCQQNSRLVRLGMGKPG